MRTANRQPEGGYEPTLRTRDYLWFHQLPTASLQSTDLERVY